MIKKEWIFTNISIIHFQHNLSFFWAAILCVLLSFSNIDLYNRRDNNCRAIDFTGFLREMKCLKSNLPRLDLKHSWSKRTVASNLTKKPKLPKAHEPMLVQWGFGREAKEHFSINGYSMPIVQCRGTKIWSNFSISTKKKRRNTTTNRSKKLTKDLLLLLSSSQTANGIGRECHNFIAALYAGQLSPALIRSSVILCIPNAATWTIR